MSGPTAICHGTLLWQMECSTPVCGVIELKIHTPREGKMPTNTKQYVKLRTV